MAQGSARWSPVHRYNYFNSKHAFNQEVGYVIEEKKLYCKVVHKKAYIDSIICDIKENRTDYKTYFTDKCTVVNENGIDILCQVNILPHAAIINNAINSFYVVKIMQIISLDDIFDVLYELHMHKPYLVKKEIFELVNKNCVIHEMFINLFWRSCETCCRITKNPEMIFKPTVEVSIFPMKHPDGNFTNIFMYLERNTNFVLLRPISSDFVGVELAYELFSILVDFGATYNFISKLGILSKKVVLKILNTLELPFKIPTFGTINWQNYKSDLFTTKAQALLGEWMENTQSSNWTIGTHIVQWMLNTKKPLDTYIRSKTVKGPIHSPYHAMFGILPYTDIVMIRDKRHPIEGIEKDLVNCSQCTDPIYKVHYCNICQRSCHFYCCHRYVEKADDKPALINTICMSCANNYINQDEEIILGT